jgi:two-component system response regulator YesN
MNLLIVEDEVRLRQALANTIPWEENGIEVIGLASNGVEALELFERKKPDIILMDVQMPEMDGLTLARTLHEADAFVKMIILSGHDNFSFAQKALEHGVSKYLLKPAGEKDILQAVLDAAEELRMELDRWQSTARLEQKWTDHLPNLQDAFFQSWFSGKYTTMEVITKSRDLLLEVKVDHQYGVAIVDIDPIREDDTRFRLGDAPLLRFTLQCMAKELLLHPDCWISSDPQGLTVLLFAFPADLDANAAILRVNGTVTNLLSRFKELMKVTASAGISGTVGGIEEVCLLYTQATRALYDRIVYGTDIAIPYREQQGARADKLIQPSLEKALEIALETGEEEKAMEALKGLWEHGPQRAGSVEDFHEAVLSLLGLYIRVMREQGWSVKEVIGDDFAFYQNMTLLSSQEQIYSLLQRSTRSMIAYWEGQRRSSSHQVVKTILTLIDQEIDKDMTLHTISDRLYVNSSYLSRLFKQETGKPFSVYVLERKMERAKAILLEGKKVYDAALMVGYRDVSYFTKVFRKYWGVTPGEMKP